MFRKKRINLNGIELPEEFSGSNIINNVAISKDGNQYAYVSNSGDLMTGKMPEDGKLEIEGTVINYKKGSGLNDINISGRGKSINISGSHISMSSIGGTGSVVISGGSSCISIGGGSDLEYEIDKSYDSVNKVSVKESSNDIELGLSSDTKVYVQGQTSAEPEYKSGRLFVERLEGKVSLPKTESSVELDIKTSSGDIDGDVAHAGRIRASSGDITLKLYAPLTVEVLTSSGDIDVKKMISEGRGIYTPPNAKSIGTLYVEASSGDVDIKYKYN